MKRMKKMLLLLCALVLCVGGYVAVQQYTATSVNVVEQEGTFALTNRTLDEMQELSWTANDTAFSFRYADGTWSKTDEEAFPVDQDAMNNLAQQLIDLEASRQLDGIPVLADYGLETPAFSVTATWTDGSATTYDMGDTTPFADGWYLATSDSSGIAYVISDDLADAFSVTRTDLAAMEALPTADTVTRITVGSALDAAYAETSATINANQHWYSPDGQPLDGVDDLVTTVQDLTWTTLVDPLAADLSTYGLAEPTAITLYNGEEEIYRLNIGVQDDTGNYYACLPGSSMVYTVAYTDISTLMTTTTEALRSTALVETAYTELAQAVFTAGDTTYTLVPPAEETEEDPGATLWDALTAITAETGTVESTPGDTLLTVQVTTTAGPEATLMISAYDAEHYVATLDGYSALVSADQVDKTLRILRSME